MVKSFISMITVSLILFFGALWEANFIDRQFNEFSDVLCVLYEKVDEESATIDDVYAVQQNWLEKKDYYSKIKDVIEQEGLLDDGELTADEIKEYFSPEKAEGSDAKQANAQLISDFLNEFEMSDEEKQECEELRKEIAR